MPPETRPAEEPRAATRVFISYSSKDREFAVALKTDLKQRGAEVWLDAVRIRPGDSIEQRVKSGMANATHFLQLLSGNSVCSSWVKREIEWARQQAVSAVQLVIGKCRIPKWARTHLLIDISEETAIENGYRALIGALHVESGRALPTLPRIAPAFCLPEWVLPTVAVVTVGAVSGGVWWWLTPPPVSSWLENGRMASLHSKAELLRAELLGARVLTVRFVDPNSRPETKLTGRATLTIGATKQTAEIDGAVATFPLSADVSPRESLAIELENPGFIVNSLSPERLPGAREAVTATVVSCLSSDKAKLRILRDEDRKVRLRIELPISDDDECAAAVDSASLHIGEKSVALDTEQKPGGGPGVVAAVLGGHDACALAGKIQVRAGATEFKVEHPDGTPFHTFGEAVAKWGVPRCGGGGTVGHDTDKAAECSHAIRTILGGRLSKVSTTLPSVTTCVTIEVAKNGKPDVMSPELPANRKQQLQTPLDVTLASPCKVELCP